MKRVYAATTSSSDGGVASKAGSGVVVSRSSGSFDENVPPNYQSKSTGTIQPSSFATALMTSKQALLSDKESIAKNTRAAARRQALGDVSNVTLPVAGNAINAISNNQSVNASAMVRGLRTRAVNVRPAVQDDDQGKDRYSKVQEAYTGEMLVETAKLAPKALIQDWDDLDAEDVDDPSMVTEYVNEIFAYLYDLEEKLVADPNYMANQTEITWKMRSVLIDWLVEVHWKLKLLPETLFLTLVGITATLVASKFEEILSPSISNFVYLSDGSYDEQEILKAEVYMLNSLQFVLSSPNPYVFLRRVSKADNYDIQTRTLAKYFLEVSLLEPAFLKYRPSLIAAASIFLARKLLARGAWNANLRHYSNYSEQQLSECIAEFEAYFRKPLKFEAIYKKYSSKKFMKASLFVNKMYPEGGAPNFASLPLEDN